MADATPGAVLVGDALTILAGMDAGSVHCCVTSPPYFGLRDYGTGTWEGGDPDCRHRVGGQVQDTKAPGAITTGQRPGVDASRCKDCGATRVDKQLGLEATPDEYVARLVAVFREVRRVLRDDGTLWLNLGDSYAGSWGAQSRPVPVDGISAAQVEAHPKLTKTGTIPEDSPFKPKDLLGIPWMVAFALRADGWYLRSEIIWSKPNPMPESVTDRPTKAHEQVFLLSKSPRYFYDADAIREQDKGLDHPRSLHDEESLEPSGGLLPRHNGIRTGEGRNGFGRNKRSVWTVATQPYPEAHFATFPPRLIEPMILAGCPRGGLVLDPFAGSGTTLQVAEANGRRGIGIELNPEYAALARKRLAGVTPSMFDTAAA